MHEARLRGPAARSTAEPERGPWPWTPGARNQAAGGEFLPQTQAEGAPGRTAGSRGGRQQKVVEALSGRGTERESRSYMGLRLPSARETALTYNGLKDAFGGEA